MSQTLTELEQRLSQLSIDEKASLALYLLESLEPAESGDIEEAWRVEAESRLAAIESGAVPTISADEVFEKLSRRLP
jgi:putative addiction module component (TIGR02574 family)